ncbi:DUF5709 domain-containing protein [Nonomuraea sp. NBC_01738]|uniref:DUF5709 domain-containing protein n=1 Tax=Nonomuraea sp. NBC_01738 TaxID=2976003 RepID=UPI002E121416|nr:DUF5709 domain-containing protein [Nonomuraea sp. NBC_01738]
MTDMTPDRYGLSDEQEIEVEEWHDDLGRDHVIEPDDPAHQDTLAERMRRELPDRPTRPPRPEHRLTSPDEGQGPDVDGEEIGEDWGDEAGQDLSAEERAVHIDPDY